MDLPLLPTINSTLNGIAAVLLFLGWRAIKSGNRDAHRNWMIAAFIASSLFLACYLYYHLTAAGITHYKGHGAMRVIYFAILITHVPLAGLMTPFILAAIWFAYKQRFDLHTRITRWLWPVWMYVSVTGVIIYLMLYILPQPA
jgi:putative membrane protein